MTDALRLDDWKTIKIDSQDDAHTITAEFTKQPDACIKCGVVGNLYRHGPISATYLDSPCWGGPTRLTASLKRFKCRDCGGTFVQPISGIDLDRRMTSRALAYIRHRCLRTTFTHIANDLGCDEKTVRNVAEDYIRDLDANYRPELSEWIGIDETMIHGEMRCVITDVGNRRPIEMLPARDKATVGRWLSQFRGSTTVRGLAIDMWTAYRDVAREIFPGLPVVIDKFHVVRMASQCMDRVRIRLGKQEKKAVRRHWMRSKRLLEMRPHKLNQKSQFNLDMWLANEPDIAAAYALKESFYRIYDLDKAAAIEAFDAWPGTIPASMKADFKPLTTAMRNWRGEILAYFDYPITNAYTEALNGVAKVANRMGRGYTYEVLRARILYSKPIKAVIDGSVELMMLIDPTEHGWSHCSSCHSEYIEGDLISVPLRNLMPDETGRANRFVCESCHARGHGALLR